MADTRKNTIFLILFASVEKLAVYNIGKMLKCMLNIPTCFQLSAYYFYLTRLVVYKIQRGSQKWPK
ncbi:MAG: hypothetical protein A2079_00660 [Geobacteraceae bacterium GWC2_48_7]|nr:MAG: hypothetical protein A2079_00660 [Geobacteraceae bacterium GWC2_48_7]